MAKPRVFVSSTYYDLKYARERLERFIEAYNMEPVLFESDEVYFNPSQKTDISCYKEVESCHLMLLIVGGRYGSAASDPNNPEADKAKEKYNNEYVSITQKEYETAVNNNIPVLICVEKNVYGDYETYLRNKGNNPNSIIFAHTDDYKVFDFISILEKSAIKLFDKIEDIELYFSNQISGMLYTYLEQLRKQATRDGLKTTLEQIQTVSNSMQEMLNSIAEKIFKGEKGKYENLITQQQKDLIDFFFNIFEQNFIVTGAEFSLDIDSDKEKIYNTLKDTIFNRDILVKERQEESPYSIRLSYYLKTRKDFEHKMKDQCSHLFIFIDILKLYKPLYQILNKIEGNQALQTYFDRSLKKRISLALVHSRYRRRKDADGEPQMEQ